MKISPVTSPAAIQDKSTPESVRTARAVQAFQNASKAQAPAPTQGQAQATPVADPNNISAEELSALNVHTEPTDIVDENTISEDTDTAAQEEKKEDPALSRQFAQLARQERALRAKAQQQDAAYKARLSELEAREAALTKKPSFDPTEYIPKARLRQDALGVLEAEGITYDQLTERAMTRQPVDPVLQQTIDSLKAQIEDLKGNVEKSGKVFEEQQANSYQAAIRQITNDAVNLVKANPEEYEAISKTGTVKEVVKLIERTYAKDGTVMTVEEAAQEVENYLVEENYKMATNIDKIKKRMQTAAQQNNSDVKTQTNPKQTQGMKTLTNAASSSRQLSAKERAILAFKGELKS